ncbi:hypothetical protein H0H92_001179 [Tricholoma furcatifolium]|nr:hypothetical protein H0H92_001179 [Tricholoma furcatifolium]
MPPKKSKGKSSFQPLSRFMDTVQGPLFSKKTKSRSPSPPGHAIAKNAAALEATSAVEATSAEEGAAPGPALSNPVSHSAPGTVPSIQVTSASSASVDASAVARGRLCRVADHAKKIISRSFSRSRAHMGNPVEDQAGQSLPSTVPALAATEPPTVSTQSVSLASGMEFSVPGANNSTPFSSLLIHQYHQDKLIQVLIQPQPQVCFGLVNFNMYLTQYSLATSDDFPPGIVLSAPGVQGPSSAM